MILSPKKELLLPRRTLLTGVAAFSAARVLSVPAEARGGHGGNLLTTPPPKWAQDNGFTTLVRQDNFDTLSTFDLTNTKTQGFNYYMNPAWANAPFNTYWQGASPVTPANNLTLSGAGIKLTPTSNSGQAGNYLTSAAPKAGDDTTYNGYAWGGGGYVEYYAKWDPPTGGVPCPALWTVSIEECLNLGISHAIEIDAPEAFYNPNPPVNFLAWDWTQYQPSGVWTRDGSLSAGGSVDYTQYNRWGLGWKTIAQNGGSTGKLQLVVNDVVLNTVTYTNTGFLSSIETQHQILLIGANTGASTYLGKGTVARPGHTVWQT